MGDNYESAISFISVALPYLAKNDAIDITGKRRSCWVFQDPAQVKKYGKEFSPWCIGWNTPGHKRKSKTVGTKDEAELVKELLENDHLFNACGLFPCGIVSRKRQ
jgi:hypothetical protein